MARPLRIEYSGAFYHVINRGLERREIYKKDIDREYFLELLDLVHEKYGLLVHSYCLMPNHYHLFLETPNGDLSKIMRQLDGNFTQKFNKRYKRVGPLFQGRYKATLIDKDSYSLQVSKYIHLNPVKAKMVKLPQDYKWSSYNTFLGKAERLKFLKTEWLLSQFHKSKKKAKNVFRSFTLQTEEENDWSPEKEAYKGIILGESDFVSEIQDKYLSEKLDPEIPLLNASKKQNSPDDIIEKIEELNLNFKLTTKLIVYTLKKYSNLTLKEIGERMSGLHYSSITQISKRLQQQALNDSGINKLLLKIDECFKKSNVKT